MAPIALLAWMPLVLCLFALLRPRHAVLAAYVGGWLFLPMYGMKIPVLPDLDKVTATSLPVVWAVLVFDTGRALSFRPRWFDLPMAAWCAAPFFSSVENGLGAWDGGSAVLQNLVLWGIPYYVGRLYFADWEGVRELAVALFVGGLIYLPLCWYEMRFSPQLHKRIWGYHQHQFAQTVREGGYRPMVFMQHGLAVGMWMAVTALVGIWLWMTGTLRRLWNVPVGWFALPLLVTAILCRSTGATVCLLAGLATLAWIKYVRNALPLLCLIALVPAYMLLRAGGVWSAGDMTSLASTAFSEKRVQSLQTRVVAEDLLVEKAMHRPAFGWGRWSRQEPARAPWRIYDDRGKDVAPTDGMWVIVLGQSGLVGLTTITLTALLPPLLYRRRVPPAWWSHPLAAPGAALAVLLALHMIDNLLNAMLNPIFVLAIGGLSALGQTAAAPQPVAAPAPATAAPPGGMPTTAPSSRGY